MVSSEKVEKPSTPVCKLKRFKRHAQRCEKTKRDFASLVALTAGFILA
ncbi:hypothetical protein MesoLjLc_46980 [Mesorhizobium sp. L-8-10]|nr:hypothetical protein MesoLjLb_47750 [Mesorhizobium sp. L-8-3]BCH32768.1 hypothetical protein MesoLjLc_46980 [Mesorhizobium sp. L-8-10]